MTRIQHGDLAWIALITAAVIYEFSNEDLLSLATERACHRNPILSRLVIFAVAGHLACVLPAAIDVFSAKNIAHRGVAAGYRTVRSRRDRQICRAA